MKTITELEAALRSAGIECLSVRPPSRDSDKTWHANTRIGGGWKMGPPSDSLAGALGTVLQLAQEPVANDDGDMGGLLG